ncbi:hypothetical protein Droror1_Dr00016787 [Drosera rotundifolia]
MKIRIKISKSVESSSHNTSEYKEQAPELIKKTRELLVESFEPRRLSPKNPKHHITSFNTNPSTPHRTISNPSTTSLHRTQNHHNAALDTTPIDPNQPPPRRTVGALPSRVSISRSTPDTAAVTSLAREEGE